ncbi:hypothetical protein INT43_006314 [Umbelopsis isabellina]|uniref:Reverse transcriptase domain-containing protein n=1 Tax=Mortierella isabellina TaxID=91625 RepID=A0A8H7ULL5_MORIS|nr:hypothetical protein INT43_006314 [Umbelopsis isabellina]
MSSLNQILYEVTSEKILELQNQKVTLESYYRGVLKRADATDDLVQEIEILYEGIKEAPVHQKTNVNMESAGLFIEHIAKDISTSDQLRRQWIDSFRKEIQYSICKCTYSYVFGKSLRDELKDADAAPLENEFYVVSKEKKDQMNEREKTIKELEERVFESGDIQVDALTSFLEQTFDMEDVAVKDALDECRKSTKDFCENLLETDISTYQLRHCVSGLLSSDLLSGEKLTSLQQLKENEPYLQDLATLLSSRLRAIKSWSWPAHGVHVDVRRSIAGRYRAFLDEDIITALFLQYIGVSFAVHIKAKLRQMYDSRLWKRVSAKDGSIHKHRNNTHAANFLSVLPDSMDSQGSFAYEYSESGANNAVNVKNSLIHLLATDAQLHKICKPDQPFTVVRTDMEWFGPSIEHESITVVMKFLGISDIWVDFMIKFLKVPMTFQQDTEEDVKVRKRGVPISHELSTLFGECLLFMMEASVNRETGISLHRIHDDFWFWDSDQAKIVQAWEVMNKFAKLVNLKFNEEKSGSAVVSSSKTGTAIAEFGPEPLPQASVKWGSLVYREDGLFQIDQEAVSTHVEEMRSKLKNTKTVLSWVNVFNKYMAFFLRSFGSCAKVFGMQHLEQIFSNLQLIQKKVFQEQNGNALAALTAQFEILQATDMLDMWAYWPLPAGGLGMKNVLLELGALKVTLSKVEHTDFSDLPKLDKHKWEHEENEKEEKRRKQGTDGNPSFTMKSELKPQTFERYCDEREFSLAYWKNRYAELLEIAAPADQSNLDAGLTMQLHRLPLEGDNLEYAQRVIAYYDNQLGRAFGSLEFIDMSLIPKSLVESINKAKVQWDD